MAFTLNPNRITKHMLYVIAVLTLMHLTQLITYYLVGDPEKFDFIELIDFDYEANLPSFYSSLAILFCAVLLYIIALKKCREQKNFRRHWMGLAIIFTFLSVDEAASLHENIGDFIESLALFEAKGLLYFAWVVPYIILLFAFALSYLKFVCSLPKRFMLLFTASGILYVFGAMGIEAFSAKEADLNGTKTMLYSTLYTIEELCEMMAIVMFSNGLMHYIKQNVGPINIEWSS